MSPTGPDPTRCPDCRASLVPGATTCGSCGLRLVGEDAARLWSVAVEIDRLASLRQELLARLHAPADASPPSAPSSAGSGDFYAGTAPGAPSATPATPAAPPAQPWSNPSWLGGPGGGPTAPRREAKPPSVQNLLLGLGVLLLAVAAIIFTAFAWGRLGVGGRAVVMAGVTASAAWASAVTRRRSLTATSEALGLLAVVLLLVDAYAVRRLGLAGADEVDTERYWAGATAMVALAAGAWTWAVGVRSTRIAALVLGQLSVPLLVVGQLDVTPLGFAVAMSGQALGLAATGAWLRDRADSRGTGIGALVSAAATWVICGGVAAGEALEDVLPGHETRLDRVSAVLVFAAAAAGAAWFLRRGNVLRHVCTAGSMTALQVALLAAAFERLSDVQVPIAIAAGGLVVVVLAGLLTPTWRRGPLVAGSGGTAVALLAVSPWVLTGLLGPLTWLVHPWELRDPGGARAALSPDEPWGGTVVTLVVLVVAAGVCYLVAELAERRRDALWPTALAGGLVIALVPLGQAWSYEPAVAWDLAWGLAALVGGGWLERRRPLAGVAVAAVGGTLSALALAWSLASEPVTLVAVPIAAAACAACAVLGQRTRPVAAGVAVFLAATWSFALSRAGELDVLDSGVVLALVAGVLLAAGSQLWRHLGTATVGVEVGAATALMCGVVASSGEPDQASATLATAGIALLVVALRRERRPVAYVGGLLLSASSWVRLGAAGVEDPEAYTSSVAVIALVLGHLRRRDQPSTSSWAAYGPGLGLGLVPSLFASFESESATRPLLLAAASIVVLLYGVRERLQAPLAYGAVVLAVDAVAQLWPYASVLPRWVGFAAAGVLLVGVGATYEARLRDLERVRARYTALG